MISDHVSSNGRIAIVYYVGEYVAYKMSGAIFFGRIVGCSHDILERGDFNYLIAPFNRKHFFGIANQINGNEINGLIAVPETHLMLMRPSFLYGACVGGVCTAIFYWLATSLGGI